MAYDYDNPLLAQLTLASVNFATQTVVNLAAKANAPKRVLETKTILGITGVIGTAGTATVSFGDGVTPARYGTFVLRTGLTAGQTALGTLTITDEGSRIGTSDNGPVPNALVLTFSGTAVINNFLLVSGYY